MEKVVLGFLLDMLKSMFFRIAWKSVTERFASRVVVYGLEKLKAKSTNDVIDNTIDDVLNSLRGKRLPVIDEYAARRGKNA